MGEFIYKWPASLRPEFLFSKDGLQFLTTIMVILLALLVCFVGTRVMVTLLFLEICVACGLYAVSVTEKYVNYDYVKVLIFLAGLAIGGSVLYSVTGVINMLIRKLHLKRIASFIVAYLIPLAASLFLWYYVVNRIYTGRIVVAVIAAAAFIGGIIVRKKTGTLKQDIRQFGDI